MLLQMILSKVVGQSSLFMYASSESGEGRQPRPQKATWGCILPSAKHLSLPHRQHETTVICFGGASRRAQVGTPHPRASAMERISAGRVLSEPLWWSCAIHEGGLRWGEKQEMQEYRNVIYCWPAALQLWLAQWCYSSS